MNLWGPPFSLPKNHWPSPICISPSPPLNNNRSVIIYSAQGITLHSNLSAFVLKAYHATQCLYLISKASVFKINRRIAPSYRFPSLFCSSWHFILLLSVLNNNCTHFAVHEFIANVARVCDSILWNNHGLRDAVVVFIFVYFLFYLFTF